MVGGQREASWEDLDITEVSHLKDGIKALAENPSITPRVAHKVWVDQMKSDGWEYGEEFDEDTKKHPDVTEYDKLPRWMRMRDQLADVTIKTLLGLGVDE